VTTPPDLPMSPTPPTDVPPGPAPEIRPYTGIEDLPGQSSPEVQPERQRPEESEPPAPPRVPPPPGREVDPPLQ